MSHVDLIDLVPIGRAIYARHAAGCCLHVTIDDGNVDDACVRGCASLATASGHDDCAVVARAMEKMSKTQRRKFIRLVRVGPERNGGIDDRPDR